MPNCIFLLRMHETPIFSLPVKNLTSPSCSPNPISCKMHKIAIRFRNFGDSATSKDQIAYFFIAHARNGHISTSGQKSDITIVFPDHNFLYDEGILAIWPQVRAKLHIFSLRIRNGVISTSCQKSDVTIVFPDNDFVQGVRILLCFVVKLNIQNYRQTLTHAVKNNFF